MGGDASSSLVADNPGGGDLTGWSQATGGNGVLNNNGGDANASITLTGSANVSANGSARGGRGGLGDNSTAAGDGGSATLGGVYAVSTGGGTVQATGEARGARVRTESMVLMQGVARRSCSQTWLMVTHPEICS